MFQPRALKVGFGALAIGLAAVVWTAPAEAGASTGTWRNGMVAGPLGAGYYGGYRSGFGARPAFGGYHGGYRPAFGGYRPAFGGYYGGYRPAFRGYYGGYRPAFGGYYGGYRPAFYGYRYRPYYRRRDSGAALAAGLVGGLALGALATAPYAYSYPYGYSYPVSYGYYGSSYYDAPACYTVRRRFVDRRGRLIIRRTQICE